MGIVEVLYITCWGGLWSKRGVVCRGGVGGEPLLALDDEEWGFGGYVGVDVGV